MVALLKKYMVFHIAAAVFCMLGIFALCVLPPIVGASLLGAMFLTIGAAIYVDSAVQL